MNEILKDFGRTFSNYFREKQLYFLRNTPSTFNIELVEVDSVDYISNSKELVDRAYRNKVKNPK